MSKAAYAILFCTIAMIFSVGGQGFALPIPPNKKLRIRADLPACNVAEYYRQAAQHYNAGKWDSAAKVFNFVALYFPETTYGQDANFYAGVSYYNLNELEHANEAFSNYLQSQTNPEFFKETIEYKFCIAERFRLGEKRRYFGAKHLPKWGSGIEIAVGIYDEVVAAMPSLEIGASALYGKGCLLLYQRDYRSSIEAFQLLISRFPKAELAPECFLQINQAYLVQCQKEFQNPDLLALAEINLRKFEEQFPGEERLMEARYEFHRIKEVYASGMYNTAYFYERINQPLAAVIYYQKAICDFPDTEVACICRRRLESFCPQALEDLERNLSKMKEPEVEEMEDVSSDIDFTSALNCGSLNAV